MKRFLLLTILFTFALTLFGCAPQKSSDKTNSSSNEEENNVTINGLSADDFVHASGRLIIGTDGEPLEIRGMAMGNSVWSNPETPNYNHHTEEHYKELSELGFNSMRFYINYGLFESDDDPYNYKESGFEWLDQNIEWAKKYNIGLILNMHHPQGGYQSGGDGMALWTDTSNQDRLVALWGEIASRYADEPTIWGYSILNEPYAAWKNSVEESVEQYHSLAKRIASEIRKASLYQMVIVERLCNVKNPEDGTELGWDYFTAEEAFPIIDDDNVAYEFHSYNPHKFTHQDSDWAGTLGATYSYSPDILVESEMESYWVDCVHSKAGETQDGWTFYKTDIATLGEGYNMLLAAANAPKSGEGGKVYFDDFTIYEVSPDGEETVLAEYDFNTDSEGFTMWSADGSGNMKALKTDGRNDSGCLVVYDNLADFTCSGPRFPFKEGYSYYLTGYIKNDGSGNPSVRLDFAKAKSLVYFNKDFLEDGMMENIEFGINHNVPLYLGEFGVISAGFIEGRNGTGWISDMIDICREHNIGFNYHAFHEGSFGLYRNSDQELPADRNDALAELFEEKFN